MQRETSLVSWTTAAAFFLTLSYFLAKLNFVAVIDILPLLAMLIMAVLYLLLATNQTLKSNHFLAWILVFPLIVYTFQVFLNTESGATRKKDLWLLILLVGASFFTAFYGYSTKTSSAVLLSLALYVSFYILEALQVSESTINATSKGLSYFFWAVPILVFLIVQNPKWFSIVPYTDMLSIALFSYCISFVLK